MVWLVTCLHPPCGRGVAGVGVFSVPHWFDLPLDWVDLRLGLFDLVRLVSLTDSFMDFCSSSLASLGLCCKGKSCELSVVPLPVPLSGIPPPCKCG